MKKIFVLTFIFLNTTFLIGQTIINNSLTADHREVRGSKISVIPPSDFAIATNFMGFQQSGTNSSIMILDIPGPFAETSKGLSEENLLKQGVIVENAEKIKFNNLDAVLIRGRQTAYGTEFQKYIFIFGTDKETIMINGVIPKSNIALDESVRKALLSAVYDADKTLTPLDAVDFEISPTITDFIFAKSMSNMLIYNRDGKMPTEEADKASMVIAKAFSKVEITDKKEFATNRIKALPVQIHKIHSVNPIEINGLDGYEIIADGVNRKTGYKEQAYQVMLFTDNVYYILFGSSESDFDKNLTSFKKIALTFKVK